jgi:hypothetical protein
MWDAWERWVFQVQFYAQDITKTHLGKRKPIVRWNTKEISCTDVHCSRVGENGRRGMSGVIKELLDAQVPPLRFPIWNASVFIMFAS